MRERMELSKGGRLFGHVQSALKSQGVITRAGMFSQLSMQRYMDNCVGSLIIPKPFGFGMLAK